MSFIITYILIATVASASAGVDGMYVYKAKGFKGTMEVKTEGTNVSVKIETVRLSNGADCAFEAKGKLDNNTTTLSYKDEFMENPNVISANFSGKAAIVRVIQPGNSCGVGGFMDGKYVKK